MASLEPAGLLEQQLIQDVDKLLEANQKNPVVPLQALWLLILTCTKNNKVNSDLSNKLLVDYLLDPTVIDSFKTKLVRE